MDSDATLTLDDMTNRLIALHDDTLDLRRDINEIKLRLFNGLTDTVRETYAKVLIVESKQKAHDEFLQQFQSQWAGDMVTKVRRDQAVLILLWCTTIVHIIAAAASYTLNSTPRILF